MAASGKTADNSSIDAESDEYYDAQTAYEAPGDSGSKVQAVAEDEEPDVERESWGSKTSYMLTLIGYAVGFGNLWRFPYQLQQYGGVFLIPYFISLAFLGIPMLYLELAIGQRIRKGPVGAWGEISPFFAGVGITSGFIALFIGFYYNTLIAYVISYLVNSFRETLPWNDCSLAVAQSRGGYLSECTDASNPSKYFWFRVTLDISPGIEELGHFSWKLYLYLLVSWFIVAFILIKGIEFTGKIVWFTALFPYIVLFIFLFFGFSLKGMENGYKELVQFNWEMLGKAKMWMDAATQIFFSLGVGCGVLVSYSSYLPTRNNCWRDSYIVALVNSATSMLSCCVVFGILGFKGTEAYNACIERNVTGVTCDISASIKESGEGTGLAFISFAEAIKLMPGSQFFNFIFFLMLMTLGIDSSFGTVEGTIASIMDINHKWKRWQVSAGVSALLTSFSVIFSFGWGNYILGLLDNFPVDFSLLSICLMECISVGWVYGLGRFSYDLQLMTGVRPNLYLLICIKYLAPLIMFALFVAAIVQLGLNQPTYSPWVAANATEHETGVPWPTASLLSAFIIVGVAVIWIPIFAIFAACNKPLLKESAAADFPEEELREERRFDSDAKLRQISGIERFVFWTNAEELGPQMDPAKINASSGTNVPTVPAEPEGPSDQQDNV